MNEKRHSLFLLIKQGISHVFVAPSKKVRDAKTEFIWSIVGTAIAPSPNRSVLVVGDADTFLTITVTFFESLTNGKKSVPMYGRSTLGTWTPLCLVVVAVQSKMPSLSLLSGTTTSRYPCSSVPLGVGGPSDVLNLIHTTPNALNLLSPWM